MTHGHAPNRPRRRTEAPLLPGQASKKDHDTRAALFMRHKYAVLYWISPFFRSIHTRREPVRLPETTTLSILDFPSAATNAPAVLTYAEGQDARVQWA